MEPSSTPVDYGFSKARSVQELLDRVTARSKRGRAEGTLVARGKNEMEAIIDTSETEAS